MKDETDKGKALFIRYGGNHGLMHHDGVFDDYQQCGVTNDLEAKWAISLSKELLRKFSKDGLANESFQKLVTVIRTFKLSRRLKELADLLKTQEQRLDSFTKLLACEQILEAAQYLQAEMKITDGDLQVIRGHLRVISMKLSNEACSVAEFYRQGALLPGSLREDAIRSRIASICKEFK